jgi:protein-disulfide isomerase
MMSRALVAVLLAALVVGSSIPAAPAADEPPAAPPQTVPPPNPLALRPAPAPVTIDVGKAPTLGPAEAPVTIVDFTDFQCMYCARGSWRLKRLLQLYPGKVRWVFKHYPLRGVHEDAQRAHEAAAIAADQGKFWEMHGLLLRNQNRLKRDDLIEYAQKAGLDVPAFTAALDTRRMRGTVLRDTQQGKLLTIAVTPTYFINGRRVIGARDLDEFKALVEAELQRVSTPGTPPPSPKTD